MKIEILFPEISGLFGDAMNAEVILRALPEAECVTTPLNARPNFVSGDVSLVYIGSMTERAQELAAAALSPYRDDISGLMAGETLFLATGNAAELFGKYIENEDGGKLEMLGLFDFYAKRRMMNRYNSLFLGKFGDMDIVGFKSQFSHIYGCGEPKLFDVVRGAGREPGSALEGVWRGNFMATYILGPLLVLNPPFLKYILELLGFPGCGIPFERAAMDAYNQRLLEFKNPKTIEQF